MVNFKSIAIYTPEQTIKFFATCLEDEPIFAMKEILLAIKEEELSSVKTLDEFGKRFAEKISLKIDKEDWNHWVAKLYRAKLWLEKYLLQD